MKKIGWHILHRFIILNFLVEIVYGMYMVFFGVAGRRGPLFRQAEELPAETVVKRRLYAIETWVAISGLAAYVGITEVLPRRLKEEGVLPPSNKAKPK